MKGKMQKITSRIPSSSGKITFQIGTITLYTTVLSLLKNALKDMDTGQARKSQRIAPPSLKLTPIGL
jgi:hypothetical protein